MMHRRVLRGGLNLRQMTTHGYARLLRVFRTLDAVAL
jgi:hypothetical protein